MPIEMMSNSKTRLYLEEKLCCCEYTSSSGERSHLLATCCNCELLDESFERLITCEPQKPDVCRSMLRILHDRIRIPFPGGAKRLPFKIIIPLFCVPALVFVGSLSFVLGMLTYFLFLPLLILTFVKKCWKRQESSKSGLVYTWFVVSVCVIMVIFDNCILSQVKISSFEYLLFISCWMVSCTCLYIVRLKSRTVVIGHEGQEDCFESGASKLCQVCLIQVPQHSGHCELCGVCFLHRDYHCFWLDVCISGINDRWFTAGLFFAFASLLQGISLTFTTICHPKMLQIFGIHFLYPAYCINVYNDVSNSLGASLGWLMVFLWIIMTLSLGHQLFAITVGWKMRSKSNKCAMTLWPKRIILHWYYFIWDL